ncbi:hypothetical protein OG21DRAFT_1483955 [Imleria badia]|nr:hypothetical protein OG21DRAFT_1483955 [Imleria badia]
MHRVLQIPEILLNVFGHCPLPRGPSPASDLPAVARTCHAFKEPALDVLWETLVDPSPLARCLPDTSHRSQIPFIRNSKRIFPPCPIKRYYSFSRSLTQIEWGILRSYTRRIRFMRDDWYSLDWESVRTFLNSPVTEPLFPNLRYLVASGLTEIKIKHFLSMPFPSLISLEVRSIAKERLCALRGSLESFSNKFFSSCICRWRDLHEVDCADISLDVDAFAHLSRMPALTQLEFRLSDTLLPFDSPLFFPNLHHLTLYSEFLDPISRLLSRTRLPAITDFAATIQTCPSKQRFSSFLASVQTSAISHTIQKLYFCQRLGVLDDSRPGEDPRVLGFEDLQSFMTFSNLRGIDLNIAWPVDFTDSELLALALAWPHLEYLLINTDWGWRTLGGITPNGLLQLLQTCRSLSRIALAIDTRGYTEFRESPASLGLSLPRTLSINVIDSRLEEQSVPAISAFFAGIAPCPDFAFSAQALGPSVFFGGLGDTHRHWYDAYKRAKDALSRRS